ncbi:MAG: hypothetical protein K9W44_01540 [Candidatus Lokiarchaeota archaeon]|nr:hypothetical protein [Candidatus Harpocratesius repetitus]
MSEKSAILSYSSSGNATQGSLNQIPAVFFRLGTSMKKLVPIIFIKIFLQFSIVLLIYAGIMVSYDEDEIIAYFLWGIAGFLGIIYIGIIIGFIILYVQYFETLVDLQHSLPDSQLKKAINYQIIGLILIQTPASIIGILCDIIGYYYFQQWFSNLARPTLNSENRLILESKLKLLYYAHIGQLFGLGIIIPIVLYKTGQTILEVCTNDFFNWKKNPMLDSSLICARCQDILNLNSSLANNSGKYSQEGM